jgi:hypothetical protein
MVLSIFLFPRGVLFSQESDTNCLINKNKKNGVKSKTEYIYFYNNGKAEKYKSQIKYFNRQGLDTLLILFSATDRKIFSKVFKKFNSKGDILEKSEYRPSQVSPDSFILENKDVFIYDEKANIVSWTEVNAAGELLQSNERTGKNDSAGNLVELITKDKINKQTARELYSYNAKGEKTSYIWYNRFGKLANWVNYFYNSAGYNVRKIFRNADGAVKAIENSVYSKEGLLKIKQEFAPDSTLNYTQNFYYDKHKNMVKFIRRSYKRGVEYVKLLITYTKNGLPASSTRYNEKGKPVKKYVYKYTYYN